MTNKKKETAEELGHIMFKGTNAKQATAWRKFESAMHAAGAYKLAAEAGPRKLYDERPVDPGRKALVDFAYGIARRYPLALILAIDRESRHEVRESIKAKAEADAAAHVSCNRAKCERESKEKQRRAASCGIPRGAAPSVCRAAAGTPAGSTRG